MTGVQTCALPILAGVCPPDIFSVMAQFVPLEVCSYQVAGDSGSTLPRLAHFLLPLWEQDELFNPYRPLLDWVKFHEKDHDEDSNAARVLELLLDRNQDLTARSDQDGMMPMGAVLYRHRDVARHGYAWQKLNAYQEALNQHRNTIRLQLREFTKKYVPFHEAHSQSSTTTTVSTKRKAERSEEHTS